MSRLVVAIVAALGAAACSSPVGSATSSPAAASSATASAKPVSESPPNSPRAAPAIAALPESVLTPIPGLTYEPAAGAPSDAEQAKTFLSYAADPAAAAQLVSGFLARTLTYQGHLVGGVEILRLQRKLTADQQDGMLKTFLVEFSQGQPTPDKVANVRVWQVDAARGTKVGAVAWLDGNDVVITWSSGVSDARTIAAAYIKAS